MLPSIFILILIPHTDYFLPIMYTSHHTTTFLPYFNCVFSLIERKTNANSLFHYIAGTYLLTLIVRYDFFLTSLNIHHIHLNDTCACIYVQVFCKLSHF